MKQVNDPSLELILSLIADPKVIKTLENLKKNEIIDFFMIQS